MSDPAGDTPAEQAGDAGRIVAGHPGDAEPTQPSPADEGSGDPEPTGAAVPAAAGGSGGPGLAVERGAIPEDLLGFMLGAPVRYTRDEVTSSARLTMEEVRRLWRAMGFPDVGTAKAFTDADLAALMRISALMERRLLDLDSVIDLARSFGQTTSRLAEWQLDTISRQLLRREDEAAPEGNRADWEGIARQQLSELLPELELLLVYVWRRQLTAVLGRLLDEFEEPAELADTATVGFADLVSFTRLSRQLDRDSLAMLVQTFETAAADVVYASGGRLVKTLGDEVMFVADGAVIAAEIGLRLHELSRGDADLPQMRIGLATGSVLMRMGDVFGTTVNRASRLTASARPGTTLMDADTADALSSSRDERFTIRAQTPRPIRGLGLIRPYSLSRGSRRLGDAARPSDGPAPVPVPTAADQAASDFGAVAGSWSEGSGSAGKT